MIHQLTKETDIKLAYDLLHTLRPDLSHEAFTHLFQDMQQSGYAIFGYMEGQELTAIAGVAIQTNFYNKKHLYVYDLVTKETARSKGYGAKLITYLSDYAREQGCQYIALESGLQRLNAHRFYERMGFEKFCYSFRLDLRK
ncbi:GNAT family N-acetyltransferase [Shouchella lonarensis]|uniref:N-acetyltransferase domain-containing protein n=1 Tax=Shouchella lonarensis TaxID=1464122 RepID=A0A1G6P5N1_9BACI|nr:GNAT family N-acetyltransferase [Shouchella lonarensis]SDC74796.1 hypothetical protein SAMN05421737_1154 [Shouchella lonarensis]